MDRYLNNSIDQFVLTITGVLGFISTSVESLNLYLAIILKLATLTNICVYLVLNHKRIYVSFMRLLKKIF